METIESIKSRKVIIDKPIVGIYFLFDGNNLIYIGQSLDIKTRIVNHKKFAKKNFDSFSFIECEPDTLNEMEADYIIRYNPIYNSTVPQNNKWVGIKRLKVITGISIRKIKKHINNNGIIGRKVVTEYFNVDDFDGLIRG